MHEEPPSATTASAGKNSFSRRTRTNDVNFGTLCSPVLRDLFFVFPNPMISFCLHVLASCASRPLVEKGKQSLKFSLLATAKRLFRWH